MPIEVKFDFSAFQRAAETMGAAADQVPFIASLTLNRAVKETREYLVSKTWPSSVTQRNPSFPRVALHIEWSNKHDLRVAIVDMLGRGQLRKHAEGGTKVPKGATLAVPSRNIKRTAHGVTRSQKPRMLRNAFKEDDRIYQVVGKGKARRLRVMYFLKKSVPVPKDVPFHEDFRDVMTEAINKELPGAIMKAMATRR